MVPERFDTFTFSEVLMADTFPLVAGSRAILGKERKASCNCMKEPKHIKCGELPMPYQTPSNLNSIKIIILKTK